MSVENFVRAETDRMFAGLQRDAGGVNRFHHSRAPTPVEHQTVIRMNRDTLYSLAVVDISDGATVTVPDSGDRYVSVMIVNQDHYVNKIFHDAGVHELTLADFETPHVVVGVRILVDPSDSGDLATVSALQDHFDLHANSARPFVLPDYERESFDATRQAVLTLAKGVRNFDHAFGSKTQVDPITHLLGTAAGWGGLPSTEATYLNVEPNLPVGQYRVNVRSVPVDGFWSVSVYNADGYFESNDRDAYSVNNITARRDDDGSITVHFGGCDDNRPNCLPITEGWNYIVRMYRPRPQVLDGTWTFPTAVPAT